jgi:hypothetical protein
MRTLSLLAAAGIALSPVPARPDAPPPPKTAIDMDLARAHFAQAKRLSDADGRALWGRPLYGPILLVDPATAAVVANEPDREGKLVAQGGAYAGTLPESVPIANTAVTFAGKRWTMVMWPLPDAVYARGRLLAHELYHRIQDDLELPALSPGNAHLDGLDGRTWLRLEWRALAEALVRSGEARRSAALDALVFRAYRRALVGPAAAEEERQLEMNEGLAEYTGYRLCGLPAGVLPDRVAARLEEAPARGFSRSFAYESGPAYGLLLDAFRPGWRARLTARSDLGDLLAEATKLRLPADLARSAPDRAARYDGAHLIAGEIVRERQRLERVAEHRRRFVDGPTLRLPLSAGVSYSFNPNGIEALDDGRSVFDRIHVVDVWGVLEASSGAMVTRQSGRVTEAAVAAPTPAGDGAKGDGWTLRLNAGWSLSPGARQGELTVVEGAR